MATQKNMNFDKTEIVTKKNNSIDGAVKNKSIFEMMPLRGDEILSDPEAQWFVGDCTSVE